MAVTSSLANIQINKAGASGRPSVSIAVDAGVSVDKLAGAVKKEITRNTDLRKKLGLRACLGCISGMDIDIRQKYEIVFEVDLNQFG